MQAKNFVFTWEANIGQIDKTLLLECVFFYPES